MRGVFFNGMMHLLTREFKILAVDTEGKTWRTISLLETMCDENIYLGHLAFIGQSQGRLYYINMRDNDSSKLSVWILEDYNGNEWIFKYNISTSQLFGELFGEKDVTLQQDYADLLLQRDYALIAIHPECNLIFFVWRCEDVLLSYDMDRGKARVICSLKEHSYHTFPPYLPYVPSFSRIGRQEWKPDSRVEADSCYRQLYGIFYKCWTFSYHN
uniref:F-box associated domain-containing protein n=1 Tax=Aegilops tauschii subsp. strangulata TaxID=200361 RepID=A0A453AQ87_AEGTS